MSLTDNNDRDKALNTAAKYVPTPKQLGEARKATLAKASSAAVMFVSGYTAEEIADTLGFDSAAAAQAAAEQYMGSMLTSAADVETIRSRQNATIGMLLKKTIAIATEDDEETVVIDNKGDEHFITIPNSRQLDAVKLTIQLMDRQARIYGSDAPQVQIIRSADAKELEELAAQLAKHYGHVETVEADPMILDAEVVDDTQE